MPVLCRFGGIVITMYYNDHNPPHFHARYGDYEAAVRIEGPMVLAGYLPRKQLRDVLHFAEERSSALKENWERAQQGEAPVAVAPLEQDHG